MTYFYKVGGTIAQKIGGEPPADEYVALDKQHTVRHIKNGHIIDEMLIEFPSEAEGNKDLMDLYEDIESKKIAHSMLSRIRFRKKKSIKSKPARKIKVVKKCTCK
jgi:hypothetical protein